MTDSNGDTPQFDPEQSNLVNHAIREMRIAGIPEEDQKILLELVTLFASKQMSGGEAGWYIHVLVRLLQFENLAELTDNPLEWNLVGGSQEADDATWQSRRNPEAFSKDGGKNYYLLSETPNPGKVEKWHVSTNHLRRG